jgi:hypothetical protein
VPKHVLSVAEVHVKACSGAACKRLLMGPTFVLQTRLFGAAYLVAAVNATGCADQSFVQALLMSNHVPGSVPNGLFEVSRDAVIAR